MVFRSQFKRMSVIQIPEKMTDIILFVKKDDRRIDSGHVSSGEGG